MEESIAHPLEGEQRSGDIRLRCDISFKFMMLRPEVNLGIEKAGFLVPTATQSSAIPLGKSGLDLLIKDKSGTGKTLIFAVILLEKCYPRAIAPHGLVMVPTREIALQITEVLNCLGSYMRGFRAVTAIGGTDLAENRRLLLHANVVVGTPGRLLSLVELEMLNKSCIEILVIDEADKMYNESFRKSLEKLRRYLPSKLQTIACSATFPDGLDLKLSKFMRNPLYISPEDKSAHLKGIKQFVFIIPEQTSSLFEMNAKITAINHIFHELAFNQCIIFCSSKIRADTYCSLLQNNDWQCELISGAQPQSERTEKFSKFRENKIRILLATDLMSRGIDSENLNLVINFELPNCLDTFLHRVGRAGRFGTPGIAITFLSSEKEQKLFKKFMTELGPAATFFVFPAKFEEGKKFDFWNQDPDVDYKTFDIYSTEAKADENMPDNEQSKHCASVYLSPASNGQASAAREGDTTDTNEIFETAETFGTAEKSIDPNTFVIDSMGSGEVQAAGLVAAQNSQMSSSQHLPTSNTIDDASSIAPDSVHSSLRDESSWQQSSSCEANAPQEKPSDPETTKEMEGEGGYETNSDSDEDDETPNVTTNHLTTLQNLMVDMVSLAVSCDPPNVQAADTTTANTKMLSEVRGPQIDITPQELQQQFDNYCPESGMDVDVADREPEQSLDVDSPNPSCQKLSEVRGPQIDIPPQALQQQFDNSSPASSMGAADEEREQSPDRDTPEGRSSVSSGFEEHTTSATSGIDSSDCQVAGNGAAGAGGDAGAEGDSNESMSTDGSENYDGTLDGDGEECDEYEEQDEEDEDYDAEMEDTFDQEDENEYDEDDSEEEENYDAPLEDNMNAVDTETAPLPQAEMFPAGISLPGGSIMGYGTVMAPSVSGPAMAPSVSGPAMAPSVSGPAMAPSVSGPAMMSGPYAAYSIPMPIPNASFAPVGDASIPSKATNVLDPLVYAVTPKVDVAATVAAASAAAATAAAASAAAASAAAASAAAASVATVAAVLGVPQAGVASAVHMVPSAGIYSTSPIAGGAIPVNVLSAGILSTGCPPAGVLPTGVLLAGVTPQATSAAYNFASGNGNGGPPAAEGTGAAAAVDATTINMAPPVLITNAPGPIFVNAPVYWGTPIMGSWAPVMSMPTWVAGTPMPIANAVLGVDSVMRAYWQQLETIQRYTAEAKAALQKYLEEHQQH